MVYSSCDNAQLHHRPLRQKSQVGKKLVRAGRVSSNGMSPVQADEERLGAIYGRYFPPALKASVALAQILWIVAIIMLSPGGLSSRVEARRSR